MPTTTTTEVAESYIAAAAEFAATDFSTPLLTRLTGLIEGTTFDVGRSAVFKAEGVNFDIKTRGSGLGENVLIYNPSVIVHGVFTFKGLQASRAVVEIYDTWATLNANAWDGVHGGFRDMPEGASKRVKEAVVHEVRSEVAGPSYWKVVGQEGWRINQQSLFRTELRVVANSVERMHTLLKQKVTWA